MTLETEVARDEVFRRAEERHLLTIGFLSALKRNFDRDRAFEIAAQGFANYMTLYYEKRLASTPAGSQERFNAFREHYTEYARRSGYIQIVQSTADTLKVRYERCPFAEVMSEHGLTDLAYAFCLADRAFTDKVLPGVAFERSHEIVKGDEYCDHTWRLQKKDLE